MSRGKSRRIKSAKPGTVPNPVKTAVQNMLALEDKRDKAGQERFPVIVMKDHILTFPSLYMDVYVAGSQFEQGQFAEVFVRAECKRADSPDAADIVIFTGGPDVNPAYYGEEAHKTTSFVEERDDADIKLYLYCMERGIPMMGVCRGAQFLHVMNGGKLYQDVDNHTGDHSMYDVRTRENITKVSSVHHQMVKYQPDAGMAIVGTSSMATARWENPRSCITDKGIDIEAFFYRDTVSFGVQGHPEYRGYNYFAKWWLDRIYEFVAENPDIELKDGNYRVKPDILLQRGLGNFANPVIQIEQEVQ